ncbi:hypothetical protein PIB30_045989 [Stylosanthes scabra]|uniref:Uncharacterized protein n=1 Tax=Stylosanthes scabra TaxID=79078 RepID=A0ABU6UIE9_9FABA|nr:hypothetical protein [Stylosanthes scabra]
MKWNTEVKDNSGGLNNATNGTTRISFRDKLVGESSIKSLGLADSLLGENMASIDFKIDDDITAISFSSEARNNAMMRIAEAIRKPIKVDLATKSAEKRRFARACIEINLAQKLKRKLRIDGNHLWDTKSQSFEFGNGNKTDETKAPQGFNINPKNVTQEFKEGWTDVVSKRRKKVTQNPSVGIKSTPNPKGQWKSNNLGKQKAATYVPKIVKENQAPTTAATVRISDPTSSVVSKPSHTNAFKTPISFNNHKRRRPRSLLNSPVDVTKENYNVATMPIETEPIPAPATLVDVGVGNDIQSAATPPVEPGPLANPVLHKEVTSNNQQAS